MALNFSNGLTGAISGGAVGSSISPGIGTGLGAIAGGVAGLFGSGKKKKKKPKRVSTFDPQTKQLYDEYISSLRGEGPNASMFNFDPETANENFDQMVSRPAYRKFNENIVPSITGQFRQQNLQNSSYAADALGRAGRDVQENLDAQRYNMIYKGQQDANDRRQRGIEHATNVNTFDWKRPQESTPSGVDQILSTLGPMAGDWFADYLKTRS